MVQWRPGSCARRPDMFACDELEVRLDEAIPRSELFHVEQFRAEKIPERLDHHLCNVKDGERLQVPLPLVPDTRRRFVVQALRVPTWPPPWRR